jgi:hypothetical protein
MPRPQPSDPRRKSPVGRRRPLPALSGPGELVLAVVDRSLGIVDRAFGGVCDGLAGLGDGFLGLRDQALGLRVDVRGRLVYLALSLDPWTGSWSFGAVRGKVPSVQGESGVSSS